MAKVTLIEYTGRGNVDPLYAARLLAYTKNTRLNMTLEGLDSFKSKPVEEILKEIEYMAGTIPSSWEFVDLVFSLQDVSRACAQQITRTRTASYAMQSQRVTDMSAVTFHIPASVKDRDGYEMVLRLQLESYKAAVKNGEKLEDARGLLPMNVHCNLIAKYNLRSLVDLLKARDSLRVQGEYQDIARQMKEQVLAVWPWAATFFESKADKAVKMIESVAKETNDWDHSMKLAKAADLIKKS